MEVKLLSSLEKVFSGDELNAKEQTSGSMLINEIYSFQLAVKGEDDIKASIEIDSPISDSIKVYNVGEIPSQTQVYDYYYDEDFIKTEPGLYPDALFDNANKTIDIIKDKWSAVWFAVEGNENLKAGKYPIRITLKNDEGKEIANKEYALEVIDKLLLKQKLVHTEWFYIECFSEYYKTPLFSEKFWTILESYIKTAVKYGQNMLYTPVFTPPYNVDSGYERITVQLVDVFVDKGEYSFNFDRLKRYIDLALSCGIEYFEISHLYSQQIIKYTPKIYATVDGEYKKIFDTFSLAADEKYTEFVKQFLTALTEFLVKEKINGKTYFHVSDEPRLEHFEAYKAAADVMKSVLKNDYKIFDALSDYEFYETGVLETPVPTNDHIEPFLKNKVKDLWVYYCCVQGIKVANRFMPMPSYRNRILATQLYKYNIAGFLHWGYNYWLTTFGKIELVDPYKVTDAGGAFPSGDSYLVYPGDDKPVLSIRIMVMNEALQDLRAFQLLEELTSKAEVIKLIEDGLDKEITFSEYPRSADYILNLREKVNDLLRKN